jgi:hypothetical protein
MSTRGGGEGVNRRLHWYKTNMDIRVYYQEIQNSNMITPTKSAKK